MPTYLVGNLVAGRCLIYNGRRLDNSYSSCEFGMGVAGVIGTNWRSGGSSAFCDALARKRLLVPAAVATADSVISPETVAIVRRRGLLLENVLPDLYPDWPHDGEPHSAARMTEAGQTFSARRPVLPGSGVVSTLITRGIR